MLPRSRRVQCGRRSGATASLYRQLHEASPHDPVPLARLAAIFMTMQDYRAAEETYRAALALDADNADLHRGLAGALLAAGDAQGAMVEVRAALAKRADDPRLYNLLGVAQDMVGVTIWRSKAIVTAATWRRPMWACAIITRCRSRSRAISARPSANSRRSPVPRRRRATGSTSRSPMGSPATIRRRRRPPVECSTKARCRTTSLITRCCAAWTRGTAPPRDHRRRAHGTAVDADAAIKPQSTAVAEARPAPVRPPVIASSLPPLLPEAAATPLAAVPQTKSSSSARHVASLADHPGPAKPKAAKVAAAPDDAAAPAPAPYDIAALPSAAAKEAAIDPVPAVPPVITPESPASARGTLERASEPPISLVTPQNATLPEPQAAPAVLHLLRLRRRPMPPARLLPQPVNRENLRRCRPSRKRQWPAQPRPMRSTRPPPLRVPHTRRGRHRLLSQCG